MRGYLTGERPFARAALVPVLLATTALTGIPKAHAAAIETVVVTAEKRAEDLQKVPFSIKALSAEKLQQLDVRNFNDYVKYLPSVTYTVGQPAGGGNGAPGFATVTFRGVSSGNDGNHSGSLPTVGIYLDEQPITTIGGSLDVPVYDVARVEALAGPQGTLYGASSEAGTVRIITNKPDPSGFSAAYDVEANMIDHHGSLGGSVQGYVNIPLSDQAAVRLVAWDEHDAGYIDNVHGTRFFPTSGVTLDNAARVRNNYNTVDKYGARAALKVDLDDNWTVTPMIIGQNEDSNGIFAFDPSVGDLKVQHFFPEFVHDYWYQAALTIEGKVGDFDLVYSGGHMQRWIHEASDYTDYGFLYDTLYPASYFGNYFYNNSGNAIPPAQHIDARDHFTKDSHEIRISSPTDGPVRFIGGLFFERQSHWIFQDYLVDDLATTLWVPGWPDTIWLTDQTRVDRDAALYGELSYDITPKLTVTGGLRGFWADNSLKGFFGFNSTFSSHTGVSQCPMPFVPFVNAPCTNLNKSVQEWGYTHKLSLKYQIDDDDMVYTTWSTGFRPGGINRRSSIPPYSPDRLINYEVGWKTTGLDGALRFNSAVFWEDWERFQFSFLGVNSFTEIHNASSATIRGVEADLNYDIDSHLNLSASGTFADAHLNANFCGQTAVVVCNAPLPTVLPVLIPAADPQPAFAPAGTQLPGTPRYKGNMTGRYEFNVDDFLAHFQASLQYQSSEWSDLRTIATDPLLINQTIGGQPANQFDAIRALLGKQPSFTTVDLATGIQNDAFSLEFFVKNVFDTRGQLYRYAECTTQVCGHEPYIVPTTPRMFGIRFGQKF